MKKLIVQNGWLLALLMLATACNKNDVIEEEPDPDPPRITFENETGVYTLKTGAEITLSPVIANDIEALYTWILDGKESENKTKQYTFSATESGTFFLTFKVKTPYGKAEEEVRMEVSAPAPPMISFGIPENQMNLLAGSDFRIAPAVVNGEGAEYEWKLDGQVVEKGVIGQEPPRYTFNQTVSKTYVLSLKVSNEDGSDEQTIRLNVLDELPLKVGFEQPMFTRETTEIPAFTGRPVYLAPIVEGGENVSFEWSVDGTATPEKTGTFVFTPAAAGTHTVSVNVISGITQVTATVKAVCYGDESARFRPAGTGSSAASASVYEYIPAPGQFINEDKSGFGGETTPEAAAAYAEKRLAQRNYVSLGGFGGFITVGFDHSIEQKGAFQGYDFALEGNQHAGSSEPGIVWVMQDVNGNGLPDDVWYELRGSETGKPETISRYAVTYTRPAAMKSPVPWVDNRGSSGQIDYLPAFHQQETYYPAWLGDSYTLRGTRLEPRTSQGGGTWVHAAYDWGYADNFGSDRLSPEENAAADPKSIYFKISHAIYPDGTPANLSYIDFIKVQTGVNAAGGWTGELSTEVFSFKDVNL